MQDYAKFVIDLIKFIIFLGFFLCFCVLTAFLGYALFGFIFVFVRAVIVEIFN